MAFTIPTEAAAHHIHMTEWDRGDLKILQEAARGNGVMSGCAVTPQGTPDMTVAVAEGSIRANDNTTHEVTAGNVTISAADPTDPRVDMVVADNTGAKQVRAGTPGPNPIQPTLTAGDVALAIVYVEAAEAAIEGTMIVDKRVFPRGHVVVVKGSDESLNNSTTLQDDDELKFWMGANETWFVHGQAITEADGTSGDFRWGASVPSGADLDFGVIMLSESDTDGLNNFARWHADVDGSPNFIVSAGVTSNNACVPFQMTVVNSGTAGYVTLQWAQWLGNADAIRVLAKSWLEAWRIA